MELDAIAGGALERGISELLRQRLIQEVDVANPAVGVDFSSVVPAGLAWELLSVYAELTTSAVVANRFPNVRVRNQNGRTVARFGTPTGQPASATWRYTAAAGLGAYDSTSFAVIPLPVPPILLLPGWQIDSNTAGLDVGDQWANVTVVVRQWSLVDVASAAQWLAKQDWPF